MRRDAEQGQDRQDGERGQQRPGPDHHADQAQQQERRGPGLVHALKLALEPVGIAGRRARERGAEPRERGARRDRGQRFGAGGVPLGVVLRGAGGGDEIGLGRQRQGVVLGAEHRDLGECGERERQQPHRATLERRDRREGRGRHHHRLGAHAVGEPEQAAAPGRPAAREHQQGEVGEALERGLGHHRPARERQQRVERHQGGGRGGGAGRQETAREAPGHGDEQQAGGQRHDPAGPLAPRDAQARQGHQGRVAVVGGAERRPRVSPLLGHQDVEGRVHGEAARVEQHPPAQEGAGHERGAEQQPACEARATAGPGTPGARGGSWGHGRRG